MAANSDTVTAPIFGNMPMIKAADYLRQYEAEKKGSKDVFLVRESSTYQGILAVSYYDQDKKNIVHLRIGLTNEGWQKAPFQRGAMFEQNMAAFLQNAKEVSSDSATLREYKDQLFEMLEKLGFKQDNMIRPPSRQEQSEYYSVTYLSPASPEDDSPDKGLKPQKP